MKITKTARVLVFYPLSGVIPALLIVALFPGWGELRYLAFLLAFPPLNLLTSWTVDEFDFWLRRKTKENAWLLSYEGKEWLQTSEGVAWLQTPEGRAWKNRGAGANVDSLL